MVARLWLQLTAQERTEVTRTVPKGVRRRADLKRACFTPDSRQVCEKIPE